MKIQAEEIIKTTKTICDICAAPAHRCCTICKLDLCTSHIVWENRDGGDHPDPYCKQCWELGEPYRKQMEELTIEHDLRLEELNKRWINEAKAKSKRPLNLQPVYSVVVDNQEKFIAAADKADAIKRAKEIFNADINYTPVYAGMKSMLLEHGHEVL